MILWIQGLLPDHKRPDKILKIPHGLSIIPCCFAQIANCLAKQFFVLLFGLQGEIPGQDGYANGFPYVLIGPCATDKGLGEVREHI